MKTLTGAMFAFILSVYSYSQTVNIAVDINQNRRYVSPYIYGKNNSLSDNPSKPLSANDWTRLKDSGIKLFRENTGNNATKYNWRLKITSAPDWYNNVYNANWDYEAQSLQQNIPGSKAMYAFQLIGKAASNKNHNFDDWGYDGAQGNNNTENWAGGGGPVSVGGNGGEGDPDLYTMNWPADSTVGILDKWFGPGGLNLEKSAFEYWNMDNEPEIWEGTHDDVMPHQISAEEFMQRYFAVAKKARAKFPDIKLVGFVPCSEWYWYAYPDGSGNSGKISYKGSSYTWVEFFIKRIAEEQQASGVRLIDVIDLHTYFDVSSEEELLQAHRIFYDETYDYPHANGVKLLGASGWDNSISKEYIFKRINTWLTQYMGANHGVTIGSTESGWNNFKQMPLALNYASTLGVFANEGVELFTPWIWSPSYWEVVHLFTGYSKGISVKSLSTEEEAVSAYSTVNSDNDSLTIVLVNRSTTLKSVQVSVSNFNITDGLYNAYILSNLPNDNKTETFVSNSNNALKQAFAISTDNKVNITLPAMSVSSVVLRTEAPESDFLGVTPSEIDLSKEAGSNTIEVYSNVDWTATSSQSWATLNISSGSETGSFIISVNENTSNDERTATITVSGTGVTSQTITITQSAAPVFATSNLIIYNDNETLIKANWAQQGSLTEVNSGAFEGNEHYRFNYNFSNWWAGYGFNLTNWGGDGSGYDFTKYGSLKFACRVTGSVSLSIALIDADGENATETIEIPDVNSTYKEITIPLSSFTGMTLEDIGEIMININGDNISGSGVFEIDNIRLIPYENLVNNFSSFGNLNFNCFPNPFNKTAHISFTVEDPGHYIIKIFDLTGREIAILLDRNLPAGNFDIEWNAINKTSQPVDNGIYVCRLTSDKGIIITRRMIFLK